MQWTDFDEAVALILREDKRYDRDGYLFVREALDFTVSMMKKPTEGPGRHISGKELLEGIRQYCLQEMGPIARTVLEAWGITKSSDFGEIVFSLVEKGALGKSESDKKEDFVDAYDFHEAFVKPFLPRSATDSSDTSEPSKQVPDSSPEEDA